MLAAAGNFGLSMGRSLWEWRLLLRFWLSILTIAAAGAATLHYLGPLPEHSAQKQVPPEPKQSARPAKAELPAPAFLAVSPTERPSSGEQSPPPLPPRTDAKAAGSVAQENVSSEANSQTSRLPPSRVLVILHPPRSEGGKAAAQQLATRAELASDQIVTEVVTDAPPRSIIRFYSTGDHALARRLGRELTQLGYAWQIENLSDRPLSAGRRALEVWLPER